MDIGDLLRAITGAPSDASKRGKSDINEIAYGLMLARADQVPLRWLDGPGLEYHVQHYTDGSIEVRPLGRSSYVVKATADGVLELKRPTEATDGYLEVRHHGDGTIWLRPRTAAVRNGQTDKMIISKVNPGVADDYVKLYEYLQERLDEVVLDVPSTVRSGYCFIAKKLRHLHDSWDRTLQGENGLSKRPRQLKQLEYMEGYTPERWAEIQAEEEKRRQYSKAYRERRKAIEAGLVPPTPRLLREREKRAAVQNSHGQITNEVTANG